MLVNAVAVVATVGTAPLIAVGRQDLVRFAALTTCALVANELTRQIERKRQRASKSSTRDTKLDTKAVWSFAAVIVLPPALASLLVVVTYAAAWFRVVPGSRPSPQYRWIFSCATVLCGTQAAVTVLFAWMPDYPGLSETLRLDGVLSLGILALAAGLRWGINFLLIKVAIALSTPDRQRRDLFANFGEQLLEAGTMGLGLVAAAVVMSNPVVLPGILVTQVALHRGVLVHLYKQVSHIDAKTGLATAGWWHKFTEQALVKAQERRSTMGLLIVDLDRFKALNDTYGHQFGDDVLLAVAKQLQAETRDRDSCGRWGGEEFAVAVPAVGTTHNLHRIAERVRQRIESIRLTTPPGPAGSTTVSPTASVGAAIYPAEGITTLDELILAADTALYEAKNGGRNTVRLSVARPLAQPQSPDQPGPPLTPPAATT
ncbi:GGDEF domain-containing protein [Phytoactinopolyspora alkaliphila]|uniref:GGDEF domain-containing protein n=1 Tax=Phytoactinopolyspora alkaliphila TaxID=1783498 RepID=A0A6N9YL59_9ACTN|nr:GGDEF domain-containing protein [Phytoactinopolyspora alkaliphila]NED95724.1 GGDEF domain-containing protein [Phytoactinopolyspora alkaliphila]